MTVRIDRIVCRCGSYSFELASDGSVVCPECERVGFFKWEYKEHCEGADGK